MSTRRTVSWRKPTLLQDFRAEMRGYRRGDWCALIVAAVLVLAIVGSLK